MSTATKQPNDALLGIYMPELKGRETVLEKRKLDPDPPPHFPTLSTQVR